MGKGKSAGAGWAEFYAMVRNDLVELWRRYQHWRKMPFSERVKVRCHEEGVLYMDLSLHGGVSLTLTEGGDPRPERITKEVRKRRKWRRLLGARS